jgi:hypothetical protein
MTASVEYQGGASISSIPKQLRKEGFEIGRYRVRKLMKKLAHRTGYPNIVSQH